MMTKETIAFEVKALCERAKAGAPTLSLASNATRNKALCAISEQLSADKEAILAANGYINIESFQDPAGHWRVVEGSVE